MSAKTFSIEEAKSMQSGTDVLKDFKPQAVSINVLKFKVGTDIYIVPLTFVQDGLDSTVKTIDGIELPMSVKGTSAKVYVATLEDGSRVWLDLMGMHPQLLPYYNDEKHFVKNNDDAFLTVSISEGVTRRPTTPNGATEFEYGTITVPISRAGRTVKVGGSANSTANTEAERIAKEKAAKKAELEKAMAELG